MNLIHKEYLLYILLIAQLVTGCSQGNKQHYRYTQGEIESLQQVDSAKQLRPDLRFAQKID